MKKLITIAEARQIIDSYEKQEISYSRMIERFNEIANKKIEDEKNNEIQEIQNLKMKARELNRKITKSKIDRIGEMKGAKMLFSMILSDGYTHREKNRIAEIANNVFDINIEKIENDIYFEIGIENYLPF